MLDSHDHPEISLHGFSLRNYQRLIDEDRWDAVGEMMLESAAQLLAQLVRPHQARVDAESQDPRDKRTRVGVAGQEDSISLLGGAIEALSLDAL